LRISANKDIAWIRRNTVTIFQIMCGNFWSHIFRAGKALGEARREIIGNSSIPYSGFYVQERLGGIYRHRMEIGRTRIGVFAVGETRESGSRCWSA
jgi:hypothetical protein